MTIEEDLRNGCAVAYRKADAILRGEPRDSNGLNRDQIAAVSSLHSMIAASALLLLLRSNVVPCLVRFENMGLFHVVSVLVFLVFDLDCCMHSGQFLHSGALSLISD